MKSIIKGLLIVSMVCGAIYIVPVVLGIMAYKKLDEATCAEDIKTWAIITLICVSPLAGILMLIMKPEDFTSEPQSGQPKAVTAQPINMAVKDSQVAASISSTDGMKVENVNGGNSIINMTFMDEL